MFQWDAIKVCLFGMMGVNVGLLTHGVILFHYPPLYLKLRKTLKLSFVRFEPLETHQCYVDTYDFWTVLSVAPLIYLTYFYVMREQQHRNTFNPF